MTTTTKKNKKKIQEDPNPRGETSTASSSTAPPGGGPDRMSELPVEILHRILGFLEMDEFLIGTSLVSTKWRNLWKSVSNLKFPTCTSGGKGRGGIIRNNVEEYQNFVDHVLRLHDSEASKIQKFSYNCDDLDCRGTYGYLERLHKFIVSAVVNQGAQEIRLMGNYYGPSSEMIHFNPSIFTSGGELRKFTFRVFNRHFLVQFPRSICCATQLTHLSLSYVKLPEGDDDDDDDESNAAQLHLVFPVLETLCICNCYSKHLKVLDIAAPRLNKLVIGNFFMRSGAFDALGECRIEIRTPNLTTLFYSGCVYVDCFTENLPRVLYANLNFDDAFRRMNKTTSFAIKLLKGLTSAKYLVLKGFEDFSQDTLKVLLTPFISLRTLELRSPREIFRILHILNICNSVEKFVWDVGDEYYKYKVEGDEHLMIPQCRLSQLKHVHIKGLRGHENEIEFVKFLLKSSVVLEDLIIKTTKNSPKQIIEENLKKFIEEEPSFRSIKLCVLQEDSN